MTSSTAPWKVDDIDLSTQEFWALPWSRRLDAMALLRSEAPFAFFDEPVDLPGFVPGPGYYAITRHADILEMSRRADIYCSGAGATSILDMPTEMLEFFGSMINMDDPRHAKIRRIVSRAFTPKMLARVTDDISALAAEIVAGIAAEPSGTVDIVERLSAPFPLTIIMQMMGIPEEKYDICLRMTNIILSGGDPEYLPPDTENPIGVFLEAGATLAGVMHELAAARREQPTEDLTSALVNSSVDGEKLTDEELASFFILLLVAGNDTTRTAISHGVLALSRNPDQKQAWMADVEGVTPTAVEEIVRYATPVGWMRRTVTQDIEYRGHPFKTGDKVILFYGAANRDPEVFTDPDAFDVRRDPNPHVGFGGPGPHFCLGANLARREIGIVFGQLFAQLPDFEVTGEPEFLVSSFINGIKRMTVTFTPKS
ncbi:MAG TPA: cytochrome P450 [Mycobacteriales bacterium]